MDIHQQKIADFLREVHLIAFKEIERLNLRIAELQNHVCQPAPAPAKTTVDERPPANPTPKSPDTGLLNEHEVAAYLKISVASVRRWRMLRTGPRFVKIGAAVRYRRKMSECVSVRAVRGGVDARAHVAPLCQAGTQYVQLSGSVI